MTPRPPHIIHRALQEWAREHRQAVLVTEHGEVCVVKLEPTKEGGVRLLPAPGGDADTCVQQREV